MHLEVQVDETWNLLSKYGTRSCNHLCIMPFDYPGNMQSHQQFTMCIQFNSSLLLVTYFRGGFVIKSIVHLNQSSKGKKIVPYSFGHLRNTLYISDEGCSARTLLIFKHNIIPIQKDNVTLTKRLCLQKQA